MDAWGEVLGQADTRTPIGRFKALVTNLIQGSGLLPGAMKHSHAGADEWAMEIVDRVTGESCSRFVSGKDIRINMETPVLGVPFVRDYVDGATKFLASEPPLTPRGKGNR